MTVPRFSPMLAVSWEEPFDDARWGFEAKLDGVRAIATIAGGSVRLRSRAGNDMTGTYPELAGLAQLPDGTVLDGEIIAYDDDGVPSFERLQGRMHHEGPSPVPIGMVAFDVLAESGQVVVDEALEQRLDRLAGLELPEPIVASQLILESGIALFEAASGAGLEGVVAKRLGSVYRPGVRSPDWRKIPHVRRTRAVVGGFTESEGIRAGGFGALLLGAWDGERLRYVGSVGTGFDHASARAIREALEQMKTDQSPFVDDPAIPVGSFVHPHLVAEIAFKQWTKAGRLRAPSFKGFSDRAADEVTWEDDGPGS